MPIHFFKEESNFRVAQSFSSPTVYLDHWAIRLFTDEAILQNRLVKALNEKEGTLLLSNISVLEFAGPDDSKHGDNTERFFEKIMPNIFFTDFAFDKIRERELSEPDNKKRFWPTADLFTLKFIAERNIQSLENMSVKGVLTFVYDRRHEFLQLQESFKSTIKNAIKKEQKNQGYITKAKHSVPSNERTRTDIIMGELLRDFVLDLTNSIKDNDVVDLMHALVPLNCCDYVLLDGAWEARVEKMNERIAKSSMEMTIAKCFSRRNAGVELFLKDLESFEGSIEEAVP